MDHRACRLCCLRQTDGVVQRVDMAGAAIHLSARKGIGPDQSADAVAVQGLHLAVAIVPRQFLGIAAGVVHFGPRIAGMGDAGMKPDGHGMISDQRPDHPLGLFGQIPQMAGVIAAHHPLQRVLILPLA